MHAAHGRHSRAGSRPAAKTPARREAISRHTPASSATTTRRSKSRHTPASGNTAQPRGWCSLACEVGSQALTINPVFVAQRCLTLAFSGAANGLTRNHLKRASWPPLQRLVRRTSCAQTSTVSLTFVRLTSDKLKESISRLLNERYRASNFVQCPAIGPFIIRPVMFLAINPGSRGFVC
jgi:hypothetical protein